MNIPFGPLEWDRSKYALNASTTVVNCLPISDGWGPMPSLDIVSDALPSACLGLVLVRTSSGAFNIYAGTQTHLYKLDTTTTPFSWEDVSHATYDVPSGDRWSFTVYGTKLIATNLNDGLLYIDIDSGTVFAAVPGAPAAKYVWVAGDFLVAGHIASNPRRVRWSAINNYAEWTLGTRGAGLQDLQIGGEVMGGIGSENGAIIVSRNAMHVMEKTVNVSASFTIRAVNESRGAISPLSIVSYGSGLFAYLSEDGFFTGVDGRPIGAERVDRTFLDDEIDREYLPEVRGMVDPYNKIIWWQYQKVGGTKALLGWHWQLNRWCYSDTNAAEIAAMATPGVTWDGLDNTYDTIDDVDIAFDSRFLAGGRPTLNGFTSDFKLGVFAGAYQAATIETASMRLGNGFTTAHEMRVVGECPSFTVQNGTAAYHGADETWSAAVSPPSRNPGVVNFRVSALIHRFRVNIAAGVDWRSMSQIEAERVSQDGAL